VVKGGNGAGKGALLGGIAGAAVGTGYGAYKTNNECGTIFGNRGFTEPQTVPAAMGRGLVTQAALAR